MVAYGHQEYGSSRYLPVAKFALAAVGVLELMQCFDGWMIMLGLSDSSIITLKESSFISI